MNRLYWHNQQVGYLCFIPFVWVQRGVIAAVADQTAMISHPCAEPLGDGHEGMWAQFGSQGSIALNWYSRYSGTRYSGTWLYLVNFSGLVSLVNKTVYKTEPIFHRSRARRLIDWLGLTSFSTQKGHIRQPPPSWQIIGGKDSGAVYKINLNSLN